MRMLMLWVLAFAAIVPLTSRADEIDQFVERQEAAAAREKAALLRNIDQTIARISHSSLDPDVVRGRLEAIRAEREELEQLNVLPNSDELLPDVYEFLVRYQRILEPIEKRRTQLARRAARTGDAESTKRLDDLESRLTKLAGGREKFIEGSVWKGSRTASEGAVGMSLTVKELHGGKFTGDLAEKRRVGRPVTYQIEGTLSGMQIGLQTMSMSLGKDQSFKAAGYVIGDRILLATRGVSQANRKGQRHAIDGVVNLRHSQVQPRRKRRD